MKMNSFIPLSLLTAASLLGACNIATNTNSKSATQNLSESVNNPAEIKIGVQIWAIANLDVTQFRNGDRIPETRTAEEWAQAGEEGKSAWCYYNYDSANGKKYGKLYNWFAVNDKRGLASNGWHIPVDAEWTTLIDYLGGADSAGIKMKSSSGWNDNGNGNNASGFTGLQGGYCYNNGTFSGIGKYGSWWSSSAFDTSGAWYRYLSAGDAKITRNYSDKRDGFSVRCLKD